MAHDPALEAHESHEHAEHAAEGHDPLITRVSITIAFLAVLASLAGSLETVEAGRAITASSEAVLHQDQATDAWGEYEADSIKKNLYDAVGQTAGAPVADLKKKSKDEAAKQAKVREKAQAAEDERDKLVAASSMHEDRHHWLTAAATLIEIGIALSTVAIITKRTVFWAAAIVLGLAGTVLIGVAYLA